MDKQEIWSEDQIIILQVFSNEFCRSIKADPSVIPLMNLSIKKYNIS